MKVHTPALYRELKAFERNLEFARWRLRNFPRVVRHRLSPSSGRNASPIVDALRRDGIVSCSFEALFGSWQIFDAAALYANRLWQDARLRSAGAEEPIGAMSGGYGHHKDYKVPLVAPQLPMDHPFVRFALEPAILSVANQYLGMRSRLRAIELWWDRPTKSPAKETQLWHRDGDDLLNLKVFIYFNDVDLETGPFCFIPRSHPLGALKGLAPEHDVKGRSTDEQMARLIPKAAWRVCMASAGTITFCDTCGYHKGLKPTGKERLLLMVQYTSATPRYPRVLELTGNRDGSLNAIQQEAIA